MDQASLNEKMSKEGFFSTIRMGTKLPTDQDITAKRLLSNVLSSDLRDLEEALKRPRLDSDTIKSSSLIGDPTLR